MTAFETYFLQTMDFFNKHKIPVFLHGSTLLRVIRNGTVEPRDDVLQDIEINLGILAEDFTDDTYRQMYKQYPYFQPVNDKLPNAAIYFGQQELNETFRDRWDLRPGFGLLARFWKGDKYRIEYLGEDYCLLFPKGLFSKFTEIEVLGTRVKVPSNPEKYLSYYFGDDWRTENKGWHWSGAKSFEHYNELITLKEL